jgi:hypothetical protein
MNQVKKIELGMQGNPIVHDGIVYLSLKEIWTKPSYSDGKMFQLKSKVILMRNKKIVNAPTKLGVWRKSTLMIQYDYATSMLCCQGHSISRRWFYMIAIENLT